jgi:beta-lactam-binding protein with PASTA domain
MAAIGVNAAALVSGAIAGRADSSAHASTTAPKVSQPSLCEGLVVPDVVGRLAPVIGTWTVESFTVTIEGDVLFGEVTSQSPAAGTPLCATERSITVRVGDGCTPTTVPAVVSATVAEAAEQLKVLGYDYDAGGADLAATVLSQLPISGSTACEDSLPVVVLGLDFPCLPMPSVEQRSLQEAQRLLDDVHLAHVPAGTADAAAMVVSQEPAAGLLVCPNELSAVELTIQAPTTTQPSTTPPPTTPPSTTLPPTSSTIPPTTPPSTTLPTTTLAPAPVDSGSGGGFPPVDPGQLATVAALAVGGVVVGGGGRALQKHLRRCPRFPLAQPRLVPHPAEPVTRGQAVATDLPSVRFHFHHDHHPHFDDGEER